jgi:hypothetical protein
MGQVVAGKPSGLVTAMIKLGLRATPRVSPNNSFKPWGALPFGQVELGRSLSWLPLADSRVPTLPG